MNQNINERMYRSILTVAVEQISTIDVISKLESYDDVLEFIGRVQDSLDAWTPPGYKTPHTYTILASKLLSTLVEFGAYVPIQQQLRSGLGIER